MFKKCNTINKGRVPWNKGIHWKKTKKHSLVKLCEECKKKYCVFPYIFDKSRFCSFGCRAINIGRNKRGANHFAWKGGVSKDHHSPDEPKYKQWRKEVFARDMWKCKICGTKEKLQAHHILRWADYPELRYDINNGITLCLAHHPRKRAEEKRLSPYFYGLVSVSKDDNSNFK